MSPDVGHAPETVVVADADDADRAAIVATLRRAGYRPIATASGAGALAAARSTTASAVVLEVALPDVSGYEVCRALRDDFGPRLPLVFVSGVRTEAKDRVAGLLVGADDYLVKPYAPDELLVRLRRLIRRSARTASLAALTERELEVLDLLAEGRSQRDIADRLSIARRTAETHIERVRVKLGARDRAHAVALAYRDELVGVRE